MDLGTEFEIDFRFLTKNATVQQLIAALEATTTLAKLTLCFSAYNFTPTRIRRFIEPLCRCLASLRRQNEHHPLRTLRFAGAFDYSNGLPHVLEQFLVAAKQFGIRNLEFQAADLPIQFLVEFCRDNNSLKVLELQLHVTFSSGAAAPPLPLNNGPPNNSVILTLDKLTLRFVSFTDSTAATVFANLVAHVNASSLCLDNVYARNHDDILITKRILSELKMPSVEQLTLYTSCETEHFKAALDAGTTTVTDLTVNVDTRVYYYIIAAYLELLASFLRRAVQLHSLTIRLENSNGVPHIRLPPHLFQAMESCTTVLQIQVIRDEDDDSSPDQVQQLQKITSRNRKLDRFATNPGSYPAQELPELLRQFDNCPTARFMLARGLPQVLSFAELYARRRTHPPTPKKAKLE